MLDISQDIIMFLNDPIKLALTLVSLSIASISFIELRKKSFKYSNKTKIALVYLHLSALFFPLIVFSFSFACPMLFGPCAVSILRLVSYSILIALPVSFIFGYFVLPGMYARYTMCREVMDTHMTDFARKHSGKDTKIYLIDSAKPKAFSFRTYKSAIFMSIGMQEMLSRKEKEAVLLHELHHIKNSSSMLKFSSFVMRISPFSITRNFNDLLNNEEIAADNYAIQEQGTSRHLLSAKKKINEFGSAKVI